MKVPARIPQFWQRMWLGSRSWTGSSCSVSLPCDRPVQIELIPLEFPLAGHIGRLDSHLASRCFLSESRPSQRHKRGGRSQALSGLAWSTQAESSSTPVTVLKHLQSSDNSLQGQIDQRICNFPPHTSAMTNWKSKTKPDKRKIISAHRRCRDGKTLSCKQQACLGGHCCGLGEHTEFLHC